MKLCHNTVCVLTQGILYFYGSHGKIQMAAKFTKF